MDSKIIIVDDDGDYLELLGKKLTAIGYTNLRLESDPLQVATEIRGGRHFDLVLIDMTMPDYNGMQLLELIKSNSPSTECIMVTAINEARIAVECLRKGAYDYLVKPVTKESLALAAKRALERKRLRDILDLDKSRTLPKISNQEAFAPIVTGSKNVIKVLLEAELHADSDVPILITGESGTGKELLARALHAASRRAKYPFTPVNMASLTSSLFEAEFFGHTKGAFTGAESRRIGHLEHTHKGTLFLDEIGDLPLELQGKLLRALQDGEFTRLGSSRAQKVDLRFIAATNENLEEMMEKRTFRKDLYYRIRGGWLHLPPLRERKSDLPLLAKAFLGKYMDTEKNSYMDTKALQLLFNYNFPGNVRELKSVLQSAANLSRGSRILATHLPDHIRKQKLPPTSSTDPMAGDELLPLATVEKTHILKVYKLLGHNKSKTARTLGIGLNTLRRKLASYG